MRITAYEKEALLALAGRAIAEKVAPGRYSFPEKQELSEMLHDRCGAFVSLYVDGELRGCIGTFSEDEFLYKNVENMAVSAAVSDTRFTPIRPHELDELELEISVLSPRKRIYDPSEIIIGKHGIYLRLDSHRGTLLPQVAVKQNWTVEEFLGNCAKYKAGIGWDGWKTAEIYTYEAFVFRSSMPAA
jgi:AmmeMemoRadiSam system protein A